MSEFNRVIIGSGPYDQKSLIAGLTNNPEGGLTMLKGIIGSSAKANIYDDSNNVSTNLVGEADIVNGTIQDLG